jgi:ssDNA-binding Zn-finger/Zn-ribbon topoisomerase 1
VAGKRVKCPNCSAPLRIERAEGRVSPQKPAVENTGEEASLESEGSPPTAQTKDDWYVQTGDGEHHGPVAKTQLDKLAAAGRLDGFCRIRRGDWKSWRWAEDVYPQLASSPESDSEDRRPAGKTRPDREAPVPTSEPRLVTCPDCGKTVSRRASQCPNCGCPAVILTRQEPPQQAAPPVVSAEKRPLRRRPVFWFATGGALVALVLVTMASIWAWNKWRAVNRVVEQVETLVGDVDQPPPEPTGEVVSIEVLQRYMREASAEWAKKVDDYHRQAYLATSLIGQTKETADLIQALAGGDLNAIPDATPVDPKKAASASYQSKYDSLYEECYRYLVKNVPPEKASRSSVWDTAQRWHDAKKAALDKELEKLLGL